MNSASDAPIRWGILATGSIAATFTEDLLLLDGHQVTAVGSRRRESAQAFADRYGIAHAHGSYEELAADDTVDVVYVATPHKFHYSAARLCLENGRAVLVEKPMTVTAAEALALSDLAAERRLFCMEAMWTRFNPLIAQVRDLVAAGEIGDVRLVRADFCERFRYDPEHRAWNPDLAGGALLDLGVYPVSFGSMLLGEPAGVRALAETAPTGVDQNTAVIAQYQGGALGLYSCSLTAAAPDTALISGTQGYITIADPFYHTESITVHRPARAPWTSTATLTGHGYTYQAEEVARCLRAGLTESPLMPLAESVAIMRTLDAVRAALVSDPLR
jgi:predicted dehydrogenase